MTVILRSEPDAGPIGPSPDSPNLGDELWCGVSLDGCVSVMDFVSRTVPGIAVVRQSGTDSSGGDSEGGLVSDVGSEIKVTLDRWSLGQLGVSDLLAAASMLGAGYAVPLTAVVFVAEYTGQAAAIVPGLLVMAVVRLVVGSRFVSGGQVP